MARQQTLTEGVAVDLTLASPAQENCEICPLISPAHAPATHQMNCLVVTGYDGLEYRRKLNVCSDCLDANYRIFLASDPNMIVSKIGDPFADCLVDPDALDAARRAFPTVQFTPVDWVELDACCGCPEGLMDPLPAQVLVCRNVGGLEVNEPVGGCCLLQELTWLEREKARGLTVKVLRERVEHVGRVAA